MRAESTEFPFGFASLSIRQLNVAPGTRVAPLPSFGSTTVPVYAGVVEVAKAVENAVREQTETHSPSKLFARIGAFMAEGLGSGWMDKITAVRTEIADSVDFSLDDSPFQKLFSELDNPVDSFTVRMLADDEELTKFISGLKEKMSFEIPSPVPDDRWKQFESGMRFPDYPVRTVQSKYFSYS